MGKSPGLPDSASLSTSSAWVSRPNDRNKSASAIGSTSSADFSSALSAAATCVKSPVSGEGITGAVMRPVALPSSPVNTVLAGRIVRRRDSQNPPPSNSNNTAAPPPSKTGSSNSSSRKEGAGFSGTGSGAGTAGFAAGLTTAGVVPTAVVAAAAEAATSGVAACCCLRSARRCKSLTFFSSKAVRSCASCNDFSRAIASSSLLLDFPPIALSPGTSPLESFKTSFAVSFTAGAVSATEAVTLPDADCCAACSPACPRAAANCWR